VKTTQGHFLDPNEQTESCLVSEASTVSVSITEYSSSLDVFVSPLHTVPCDSQLNSSSTSISEALHFLASWADGGQLKRATWKHYCVTPLAHSANSHTVGVKCVRLFILREVFVKIHNVHNCWGVNLCNVECVKTVLATGVIPERT